MNLYAAISLVTLIAVILLGFFRKVNVGLWPFWLLRCWAAPLG